MTAPPSTAHVHAALAVDLQRWFGRRVAPDVADDLVQETFLRVHRGLPGLRDVDRLAPWVMRLAHSVWVDHLRRQRDTTSEDAVLEGVLRVEPQEPDPARTVALWLPGLVELLPEPYREAVPLSELEGLSQAEVARRLDLSASGARSRVQCGRHKLREQLEACCEIHREGAQIIDYTPRDCPDCG